MKSLKLIIPIAVVALMVVTNPPLEDHKAEVKTTYMGVVDSELNNADLGKGLNKLAKGIGGYLVDGAIESRVSRDNFLVMSITRFKHDEKDEAIGIGIFGNVFLFGKAEFDREQLKKELNLD